MRMVSLEHARCKRQNNALRSWWCMNYTVMQLLPPAAIAPGLHVNTFMSSLQLVCIEHCSLHVMARNKPRNSDYHIDPTSRMYPHCLYWSLTWAGVRVHIGSRSSPSCSLPQSSSLPPAAPCSLTCTFLPRDCKGRTGIHMHTRTGQHQIINHDVKC